MSVVGPLMGVFLGIVSVQWLELNQGADRDANVEVICTLAMPFLVFYLAETAFSEEGEFQMSGVLAVVAYGLVFASPYGKVRIDPGVEHFLHEFWAMIGHLVNTLIFVMAGVIIILKVHMPCKCRAHTVHRLPCTCHARAHTTMHTPCIHHISTLYASSTYLKVFGENFSADVFWPNLGKVHPQHTVLNQHSAKYGVLTSYYC